MRPTSPVSMSSTLHMQVQYVPEQHTLCVTLNGQDISEVGKDTLRRLNESLVLLLGEFRETLINQYRMDSADAYSLYHNAMNLLQYETFG